MPILQSLAAIRPDHLAVRMADGSASLTLGELDRRADQVARWFVSLGLQSAEVVALLLENHIRTFELWWGARRAGLYYTPISVHARPDEVAYLLADCGAKVLVTSRAQAELASTAAACIDSAHRFMLDGASAGFLQYEEALSTAGAGGMPQRPLGREFFYSSGTTGRPKGIRRPLTPHSARMEVAPLERTLRATFAFDRDTIYLSPSPLYHATGRFIIRAVECGGSAVVMSRFDAESALAAIARWRVTHAHWVPTMMVRMLTLPAATRACYDLSSLRCAIHATAPCPPQVKQQAIDWWGPVVVEYYGGSENAGVTFIDSRDWLGHRGSVGRPIWGEVHILDEAGRELGPGSVGTIYFDGSGDFAYHNDPEKTATAFSPQGWSTYGDLGHLDSDGYLYLSDRRDDLIISGGVNIYPAEIEHVLAEHEVVADVAVVGRPHAEYGQEVVASVHLRSGTVPSSDIAERLRMHCLEHLSKFKAPRAFRFVDSIARNENGKLLRRIVRSEWESAARFTSLQDSSNV